MHKHVRTQPSEQCQILRKSFECKMAHSHPCARIVLIFSPFTHSSFVLFTICCGIGPYTCRTYLCRTTKENERDTERAFRCVCASGFAEKTIYNRQKRSAEIQLPYIDSRSPLADRCASFALPKFHFGFIQVSVQCLQHFWTWIFWFSFCSLLVTFACA